MKLLIILLVVIPLYLGIGFVLMCYYNAVNEYSAATFDVVDFLFMLTWPITMLWWLSWELIKKLAGKVKFRLVMYFRHRKEAE